MRIVTLNIFGFAGICIAVTLACICIIVSVEVPNSSESIVLPLVITALVFQGLGGSLLLGVCLYQKCWFERPVVMDEPTEIVQTRQLREIVIAEPQAP
jgi:hypothetical protein